MLEVAGGQEFRFPPQTQASVWSHRLQQNAVVKQDAIKCSFFPCEGKITSLSEEDCWHIVGPGQGGWIEPGIHTELWVSHSTEAWPIYL